MSETNEQRNPHAPFQDAWDKERRKLPPQWEDLRAWHDHLSALTWTDEPKEQKPMKMDEAFPGNYVKADQITAPVELVIDYVDVHKFEDGNKPVAYFRGRDAGVVLNKRRFAALVELCRAEDSDDWKGHPVVLTREPSTHPNAQWMLKFERSERDKPDGTTDARADIPF